MKLINWINHKLFLHAPLWVCASIGVALSLLLPESIAGSVFLVLFFGYFVIRYLWRKRLKKHGQLGSASSGIFSLVFFGVVAAVGLYDEVTPDSPKLVLYETSTAGVFGQFDKFDEIVATDKKDESGLPITRRAKKGVFSGAIAAGLNGYKDEVFVCDYVFNESYDEFCKELPVELTRVTLDLDEETIELLLSDKKPEDCVEIVCNVWLLQTTQSEIDRFIELRKEAAESGLAPPVAVATLLGHWKNIVTPVRVFNEVSDGWRHVEFTDGTGEVVTWNGKP